MMGYGVRYVPDSSYIIGDSEYGFDLCRVDMLSPLADVLSDVQRAILADGIMRMVVATFQLHQREDAEVSK